MPQNGHKKRKPPISYRPPVALEAEFAARVQKSGLSTSGFITQAVFGAGAPRAQRTPAVCATELARLNIQLARLIDALNAAQHAGVTGQSSGALISELHTQITEIRAAMFKALGRSG